MCFSRSFSCKTNRYGKTVQEIHLQICYCKDLPPFELQRRTFCLLDTSHWVYSSGILNPTCRKPNPPLPLSPLTQARKTRESTPFSPNPTSHQVLLTPCPDEAHISPFPQPPGPPPHHCSPSLCSKHTLTPASSALTPSSHLCKSLPMIFLEKISRGHSTAHFIHSNIY